ncbi:hypothetical protein ACFL50_05905 [Candidatus Latescibacterota bacterium]
MKLINFEPEKVIIVTLKTEIGPVRRESDNMQKNYFITLIKLLKFLLILIRVIQPGTFTFFAFEFELFLAFITAIFENTNNFAL